MLTFSRGLIRIFAIFTALAMLGWGVITEGGHVSAADAKGDLKTIDWETLLPETPEPEDPLASLTPDQRYAFDEILLARGLDDINQDVNAAFVAETKLLEDKLRKSGLDLDRLLAEVYAYDAKIEARGNVMRAGLDGQRIRMAGYLLPLTFSEKGEKEFLLVPYVGACVHVPPPPPNQLVFVTLDKPMIVTDVFTPVWVSGKMSVKRTDQTLNLADGSATVPVGYSLSANDVAPYKAPKRNVPSGTERGSQG